MTLYAARVVREIWGRLNGNVSLNPNHLLSLDRLFRIIYNEDLTLEKADDLKASGVLNASNTTQLMRRIIGGIDRQRLASFSLAIDTADVAVGLPILHRSEYEPHLTSFVRKTLKAGMHAVDIGANIGFFTMLASVLVGETGRVTAFEPNSENTRLILLSVTRNDARNVSLLPVALSTTMGNAFFSSHMGSNGGLLPADVQVLMNPQCVVVPTFRLDQLITDRIDFIKSDTEGAEGLVFEGAWPLIERDRPVIASEFSPEMLARVSGIRPIDYLERFKTIGYRVLLLERDKESGDPTEILDLSSFMAEYGQDVRIEDLVFMPSSL